VVLSGISPSFPGLSQTRGQITHALLTRAPLVYPPKGALPYDLHVLSTPPAFVLSQDQTLQFKPSLDATLLCGVLNTTHFHVGRVVRNVDASLQPKCRAASQMGNTCPMAVNRAFPRSIDRTLFSFQRPSDTPPRPVWGPWGWGGSGGFATRGNRAYEFTRHRSLGQELHRQVPVESWRFIAVPLGAQVSVTRAKRRLPTRIR
jgi:hypothetical protein